MRKKVSIILLLALLCAFVLPAMAEDDPFVGMPGLTKFDEVVEVRIARSIDPTDTSLVGNDTVEDNYYTRFLLEHYNIKIIVDWTASGEDYDQKMALAITSNDLPDAFIANYTYWKQAADAGLLMEISDIYEQYACDKIKYTYDVTEGRAMEACMLDGEMYGLANTVVQSDGTHVIMIRQDWLDAVGMEMPTTVDELHDVAVVFRDAKLAGDKTIPIMGPANGGSLYTNFASTTNLWWGFDPIFNALGAFPGYFLNQDGQAVYGSLTDEFRASLELLAGWYAEGLIDKEIGTRSASDEPMNANLGGMFVAPWWAIGYGNASSFYNDENVNWQSLILENKQDEWVVKEPFLFGGIYLCINADASEDVAAAALTAVNVMTTFETVMTSETSEYINSWYPLRLVCDTPDIVEYEYAELMKVIAGEASSEAYKDEETYVFLYGDAQTAERLIHDYVPGERLNRSNFTISPESAEWQRLYSILIGDRILATRTPDQSIASVLYNHTDLTERYWSNLWSAEMEMVFKIITGQEDIGAFDRFMEQWLKEGGQEILAVAQAEIDRYAK